jgi:NhaP-type Na+/H+ or K+/H+ antiporter
VEITNAYDPALTVAVALAAGIVSQVVARHLRLPGIVLLLAVGALLGPDVLGLVQPVSLGASLHLLVGFAVAIVLFEGSLHLDISRLSRQADSIRHLVTIGAAITAVGGAMAARWILDWEWRLAVLFGTLVIVTGPTVINPLVRRIRLKHHVATVLEAEGVFGDAIGALAAVVALEITLAPTGVSLTEAALQFLFRLGTGALMGVAAGFGLALLLRHDVLIPRGLENVFALAMVLLLFQGANTLLHESGVVAVIAAGATLANFHSRRVEELKEFKEQLTVLMLGMLFVLLAADVRLEEITALGWKGLTLVAALMFLVRPINVFASTIGSDLTWRDKAFVSWLAPRGIVAAAVSSLFAQSLTNAGVPGGSELRAMVFLVIAVTVTFLGLTSLPLAQLLKLRSEDNSGYAILGASALGLTLAGLMRDAGEAVVMIDSNPQACKAAEQEGHRVVWGSALSDSVLTRARLEGRAGAIAVTSNDEVNYSFARRSKLEFRIPSVWIALDRGYVRVRESMLRDLGGRRLFAEPRDLASWAHRLERGTVAIEAWLVGDEEERAELPGEALDEEHARHTLPLAYDRGCRRRPFDETFEPRSGDRIIVAIDKRQRDAVAQRLQHSGWRHETTLTPVGSAP